MNPNQHMQLSSLCAVCDAATECSDAHACKGDVGKGRASQALGEADSWDWRWRGCWNDLSSCWKLCLKICSPPLHHVCRRHERCMASDAWAETCANCRLRWPRWAGCRSTGHEYSAWFCSGPWGRLCVQAHVLPGRLCCDESLGHRKRVWRS